MSAVLDGLKERLETARLRIAAAQQAYSVAQAELQAANAEFNIWNSALNLEAREEEKRLADSREKQIPMDLGMPLVPNSTGTPVTREEQPDADHRAVATNQTEKVREILREHASGISPAELWTELRDHISNRPYLYSILKRLRDSDEVFLRKGKYLLKFKPVELKTEEKEAMVIQ